jgi:hypothetical protein
VTVLIAGNGYSGSTLLSLLLTAHPALCSIGELTGPKHMPDPSIYPCSCGVRLDDCPFWSGVFEDTAAAGQPLSSAHWDLHFTARPSRLDPLWTRSLGHRRLDAVRDALVRRAPVGRRLKRVGERNRAALAALRRRSGRPVVVDASKDPRRAPYLRDLSGEQVAVIHLVRDAPGFVASAIGHGRTLDGAVASWLRMRAQVKRLAPDFAFTRLRYEDVVADPLAAVNVVARLAGQAPIEALPAWNRADAHVIGNRMRHRFDGTVRLDDRWKERLTEAQVAEIRRRTA